jgi:putative nucleotidyltransferase with HDIG domain
MTAERITGIILAAGFSSRMAGEFKPLLPLGKETILERVVGLFQQNGIDDIRVVTGHRAAELMPVLQRLGIQSVHNENYHKGMLSSVKAGLRSLRPDGEALFLQPVDIPLVRPRTLAALISAFSEGKGKIFYPTFRGRRGHPPLISKRYVESLLTWDGGGGVRAFLERHDPDAIEVPVVDEYVLFDVDTPADYRNLKARYRKYDIPTIDESLVLLEQKAAGDQGLVEHSCAVAGLALDLAKALNRSGCRMDLDLIGAAGLLHDVARGEAGHARVGEEMLRAMGYPTVAEVVGAHMDLTVTDDEPLQPHEVVYLADKLVQGTRAVSLEKRFRERLERYARNPKASAAIASRQTTALKIKRRLEQRLGRSLECLLKEDLSLGARRRTKT